MSQLTLKPGRYQTSPSGFSFFCLQEPSLYTGTRQRSGPVIRSAALGGMVIRLHILCRLLTGALSVLVAGAGRTAGPGRRLCRDGPGAFARARIRRPSGGGEIRTKPAPASVRRRTRECSRRPARGRTRKPYNSFSRSLIPQPVALFMATPSKGQGRPVILLRRPSALSLRGPKCKSGGYCWRATRLSWRCAPMKGHRAGACSVSPRPASG